MSTVCRHVGKNIFENSEQGNIDIEKKIPEDERFETYSIDAASGTFKKVKVKIGFTL